MKRILLYVIILVIFIGSGSLVFRKLRQHSILKTTRISGEYALDTLQQYDVNGVKLTALIRGTDIRHPILLHVHGGPGMSSMLFARKYDEQLVGDFVVIHYDQRGTGRSYFKEFDTTGLTVDVFVNDLIEITKQIREQFPSQKLILLGESWGSLIGVLAVRKNPELFDAYVGTGQIADLSNSDRISYDYVYYNAKKEGKKKIFRKISRLNRNSMRNYDELIKQRRLLKKMGGTFYRNDIRGELMRYALVSPGYSLCDLYRIRKISRLLGRKLYPEMVKYNFIKKARKLPVPCFFIEGRYDFMVPSIIAENYYFNIEAPYKRFYWFEKSGHAPQYEEPERFARVMDEIKDYVESRD
jgi:pimeloyl-ACP methyl ester carboxylesterase